MVRNIELIIDYTVQFVFPSLFGVRVRLTICFLCQGYEYVETDSDECCGNCVQTHCVVNVNDNMQVLKVSWIIAVGSGEKL